MTFSLEMSQLVAIEIDTHVLFAVLGIMPYLAILVAPKLRPTQTIMKLHVLVSSVSFLISKL